MEKLYRVQMNKHGMPNFSTAEEVEPCKDAVSRQAVIDMLDGLSVDDERGFEFGTEEETFIGKYEAITNVSDLPSVTIEPKHGEWIFQECTDESYGRAYECSICGVAVVGNHHNFCPNCGAKMKGADE